MGYSVTHTPGDSPGIVYLMRRGPYYKIGRTVNLKRRLQTVRIAITPTEARNFSIELVWTIECKDQFFAEKALHRRLDRYRADCGEWFLLPENEIAWICQQTTDVLLW